METKLDVTMKILKIHKMFFKMMKLIDMQTQVS